MASIVNEIVSVIVKLVITVAGTAFMTYGIPYLKQIGMYKIVQMAVRAAEKLGVTGAIKKADKKKYVIAALEKMNIKITPTIEMMIEAAVKEMDIQNEKINAELKKDWNKKLSKNFCAYEFACNDRSDEFKVATELVETLQQIRDHFGKPVLISSAYRTPAYNISIGGSSRSQHCLGTAADIHINGVDPIRIALYVASLPYFQKHGGIGYYSRAQVTGGFVHVDVRETHSRWVSKSGTAYQVVSKIMPTIRQGSKDCTGGVSYAVTVLQRHLGLKTDGIFGAGTKAKLVEWQKAHGLAADGICGMATWSSF